MHGKKRSVLQQSPDSIIPRYKDIIQSEKETVSKPTRYFHSQLENISQRRLDLPYQSKNINVGEHISLHGGGGGSVTFHKGEGFNINPDLMAGGSINLGKTRVSGEYGTGGRFNIGGSTNIAGVNLTSRYSKFGKEGEGHLNIGGSTNIKGVGIRGRYSKTEDQPGTFSGGVSTNIKGVDVSGSYSKFGDKPSYSVDFSKHFANKRFNLGVSKTGGDIGFNIGANIKF